MHGPTIDEQTRCVHYNTALDVIAIKFVCCGRYYPCFECHAESEQHPAAQWPRSRWGEPAILCGGCRSELSIDEYKLALAAASAAPAAGGCGAVGQQGSAVASVGAQCPRCGIPLNERCSLHSHLYFAE